jgi:hypothetical protein
MRAGEMRAGEMEFRSSYYNIKRNRWRCTDLLFGFVERSRDDRNENVEQNPVKYNVERVDVKHGDERSHGLRKSARER